MGGSGRATQPRCAPPRRPGRPKPTWVPPLPLTRHELVEASPRRGEGGVLGRSAACCVELLLGVLCNHLEPCVLGERERQKLPAGAAMRRARAAEYNTLIAL